MPPCRYTVPSIFCEPLSCRNCPVFRYTTPTKTCRASVIYLCLLSESSRNFRIRIYTERKPASTPITINHTIKSFPNIRFIRYAMPMLMKIVTTIVNPICVIRYNIFITWLLSLLFIQTLPIQSDIHKAYYIRFFLNFQSFILRIRHISENVTMRQCDDLRTHPHAILLIVFSRKGCHSLTIDVK